LIDACTWFYLPAYEINPFRVDVKILSRFLEQAECIESVPSDPSGREWIQVDVVP